jgi:hypothetical protein
VFVGGGVRGYVAASPRCLLFHIMTVRVLNIPYAANNKILDCLMTNLDVVVRLWLCVLLGSPATAPVAGACPSWLGLGTALGPVGLCSSPLVSTGSWD